MQVIGLISPVEMLLVFPAIDFNLKFCDPDTEWVDADDVCQPLLLQCPAGEYLYGDGKQGSSCIPCPRNMYKDQANSDKECVLCPDWSTNPVIGGTSLTDCRCVCVCVCTSELDTVTNNIISFSQFPALTVCFVCAQSAQITQTNTTSAFLCAPRSYFVL